jgi:para-nitrobenzyl esterase
MAGRLFDVSRRAMLKTSAMGGAFAALPVFAARAADAAAESSSMSAVVDTAGGKVRGVVSNGVHVYRGIPYGASTVGANRFMPPRKAEPWSGVRDAFQSGHASPQVSPPPGAIGAGLRGYAAQGEDCLVLNVFSTGVNDNRKRPVMMWIHGGGYTYGSGSSLGYDGAKYPMARRLASEVLSLPVHPGLSQADLETIVSAVNAWAVLPAFRTA